MFISISIYLLQLLNLGLLFHAVLGYEFRSSKVWTGCALVMVATGLIIRVLYWDNMPPLLGIFFLDGMLVVLPAVAFEGNCLRKLLLSMNYRYMYSALYGVIATLFELDILNILRPVLFSQITLILLQGALYVWLRRKQRNIYHSVENVSCSLLLFLAVCLILLGREVVISPKAQDDVLQILIGQSQFLSVIIVILLVYGVICMQRIAEKNTELLYLNQLNEKHLEVQVEQYKTLEEKDFALRKFRHDYKTHMGMLQYYLQDAKYDEAAAYLEQLGAMRDKAEYISTENLIANAILNECVERGKKDQIEIDYHGVIPTLETIKETDFCALFANAMKNAYEAAAEVPGQKIIVVRITNQSGYLFISIKNPSNHGLSFCKDALRTNKAEPGFHGFGSRVMKKIAERNAGAVKWQESNGYVETKISIRYAEK